jgi:hypothetical protein
VRICWRLGPVDRHRVRRYSGEFDEWKISRFALYFQFTNLTIFVFFLFFLARRNFLFYSLEFFFYHVSCQFKVEVCFNLGFFFFFSYSQSQSRQEQSYKHDQLRTEMEVDYLLDRTATNPVDYCLRMIEKKKRKVCSKKNLTQGVKMINDENDFLMPEWKFFVIVAF